MKRIKRGPTEVEEPTQIWPLWYTMMWRLIGKLAARTIEETNRSLRELAERMPRKFRTITADNGCEFHGYEEVELSHGLLFYFAPPHHSWERGSNENANGLIRQYFPKSCDFTTITQRDLDHVMHKLNNRPRKCLGMQTPNQVCFGINPFVALVS